jgi:hypothetical protein
MSPKSVRITLGGEILDASTLLCCIVKFMFSPFDYNGVIAL